MGGEVELSYPVLGPDSFVSESLREQVGRHRERRHTVPIEIDARDVVERQLACPADDN
jgi:hypothetical protein